MGRTKDAASTELDDKSPTSHIARTDQDEIGKILRRNIRMATWVRTGRSSSDCAGGNRPCTTCCDTWSVPMAAAATTSLATRTRDRRLLLRAGLLGSAGASGGLIRQS